MALRCSIQRGVRILYTYTCVHTHTHGILHTFGEKKRREEEEESRVWSARRVINERRIPADKEEPPECSGPPDLTAQPARSFAGGSLRVAYNIPYSTYGIPKRLPMMVVSIHKNRISFLLFYIQVGRRNVTNRYYYYSRYYYFILNIPYQQDRLYGTICRQMLFRDIRGDLYILPVEFTIHSHPRWSCARC